eukprot:CAMPEP_0197038886 /NCGR_PEP_ID=MMETSP1384-20130603/15764_1 /TAXON_ID=29189 /ORGANISM="Ammonia sp." /LENGTH=346 /DNA_ID=CAMNT_0042469387 /DNA_START=19 /DNA_END=1059 /DNA_ORIENTATION=-
MATVVDCSQIEICLLKEKNRILTDLVADATSKYMSLMVQFVKLKSQNSSLIDVQHRYDKLCSEHQQLRHNYTNLKEANTHFQQKHEDDSRSHLELQRKFHLSQRRLKEQQNQIEQLRRHRLSVESRYNTSNMQLTGMNVIVNQQNIAISNLTSQLEINQTKSADITDLSCSVTQTKRMHFAQNSVTSPVPMTLGSLSAFKQDGTLSSDPHIYAKRNSVSADLYAEDSLLSAEHEVNSPTMHEYNVCPSYSTRIAMPLSKPAPPVKPQPVRKRSRAATTLDIYTLKERQSKEERVAIDIDTVHAQQTETNEAPTMATGSVIKRLSLFRSKSSASMSSGDSLIDINIQ